MGRIGQLVRWGLVPAWAKDPSIGAKLINARAETVESKPSFRSSFARHRCLIPASGFYEWKVVSENGKVRRQPYYVRPAEGDGLFAFAGLLVRWRSGIGEDLVTACIITTEANALMAPIHDRMPVMLPRQHWSAWLDRTQQDPAALAPLMSGLPDDAMQARAVDRAVGRSSADGPQLIEPLAPVDPS